MRDDDSDFTLRPGKVRSRGISQSKSFFSEVMRAMNKAGAKAGLADPSPRLGPASVEGAISLADPYSSSHTDASLSKAGLHAIRANAFGRPHWPIM
jgi:hypothetical protein